MKPSSDVIGLYRSFPAYLWVEDEETRTYLETAWNGESLIKVLVAAERFDVRVASHGATS